MIDSTDLLDMCVTISEDIDYIYDYLKHEKDRQALYHLGALSQKISSKIESLKEEIEYEKEL